MRLPDARRAASAILILALCAALPGTASAQSAAAARYAGAAAPDVFVCPMHPEVRSASGGACRKCGMSLVKSTDPAGLRSYNVELTTNPERPRPGDATKLEFRISNPFTDKIARAFNVVHEKYFHLFVISEDQEEFQHIHPAMQADGTWTVETRLPKAGDYQVVCDFFPVGGWPQVVRRKLTVEGAAAGARANARSAAAESLSAVVDGTRAALAFDLPQPASGIPVQLKLQLSDAGNGAPATDLEPFLGAWAHAVVLSVDGKDFVHLHPLGAPPDLRPGAPPARGGPAVSFAAVFPRPGPYRMWCQFQRGGRVGTARFDIRVLPQDPVAVWDGGEWKSLAGRPVADGPVRAVAGQGGKLYAAVDASDGSTELSRIMTWDGGSWSPVGEAFAGNIWTLAVQGDHLYAGGDFRAVGDRPVKGVARWDGSEWTQPGGGVEGCADVGCAPVVYALALDGSDVYAGGRFAKAGGVVANGIARWDGSRWHALGGGVGTGAFDGVVRALAVVGNSVYAGGSFKTAGGSTANNIARWQDGAWHPLGGGVGGGLERVLALGPTPDGKLFVGGQFGMAGLVRVSNTAVWDGGEWRDTGIRAPAEVATIAVSGSVVYLGGSTFILPSGERADGVVKWDGSWSRPGRGVLSAGRATIVRSLAASGASVIAGGDAFVFPGGATDSRVN